MTNKILSVAFYPYFVIFFTLYYFIDKILDKTLVPIVTKLSLRTFSCIGYIVILSCYFFMTISPFYFKGEVYERLVSPHLYPFYASVLTAIFISPLIFMLPLVLEEEFKIKWLARIRYYFQAGGIALFFCPVTCVCFVPGNYKIINQFPYILISASASTAVCFVFLIFFLMLSIFEVMEIVKRKKAGLYVKRQKGISLPILFGFSRNRKKP